MPGAMWLKLHSSPVGRLGWPLGTNRPYPGSAVCSQGLPQSGGQGPVQPQAVGSCHEAVGAQQRGRLLERPCTDTHCCQDRHRPATQECPCSIQQSARHQLQLSAMLGECSISQGHPVLEARGASPWLTDCERVCQQHGASRGDRCEGHLDIHINQKPAEREQVHVNPGHVRREAAAGMYQGRC